MDITVTYVGNATTLISAGGLTLLTDPNFLHRGQRAYLGHGLVSKRLKEPALHLDDFRRSTRRVVAHARRPLGQGSQKVSTTDCRSSPPGTPPSGDTGVASPRPAGCGRGSSTPSRKAAAPSPSPRCRALTRRPSAAPAGDGRHAGIRRRRWRPAPALHFQRHLVDRGNQGDPARFEPIDAGMLDLGGTRLRPAGGCRSD